MLYQYPCACCEKEVTSYEKSCPHCGSQHIRSPYGGWLFCIFACLLVAITFKLVHVYIADHQEVPKAQTLLKILNYNSADE